ncbi:MULTISPECIES: protein kinase domain-containing protein [unclassified Caballeronia]|uniref:serine/threonine protein kinase n=1 Tax=unclassified Caballeronia TaxID=2646786 RepID=UPI002864B19A|nr:MULTISPECIES: protein kinase [unclassified Caballeronia]MDR5739591.1 protein kinase [Caballeronia sp. LZ016]MDR5808058.1 protein kinase [Caballeronia sp. LZ019]
MTSFREALRTYRGDGGSRDAFFAGVDGALAADRTPGARLIEILDEENAANPLPRDIYSAIRRRIEHTARMRSPDPGTTYQPGRDETRLHVTPDAPPPLPSRATGNAGAGADTTGATSGQATQVLSEADQVKGVGDTLNNRFVLEECLGIGGMGTVYKALDLRKLEASDRRPYVAIKVLNLQFRGNPKSLIALQREARKAQQLAHRNIVTVYDFDRDGAIVYLTMEYLSGQPLSKILRSPKFKGMPFHEMFRIFKGMATALAYAHERGFVHCDFKPANVFVTDAAEVKVIDFGIARVIQRPEEDTEATVFDPGSLGALTPAYASPEMLEHREPDPRDDIYALGCIAYELLTGKHPFDRVPALQAKSAGMKPQRPDNLGNKQWKALKAALAFEREERTPTVAQFLDELSEEQPAAPAQAKTKRIAAPKLAIGALALVLIAGAGYVLVTHQEASTPAASVPIPTPEKPAITPALPAAPAPTLTMAAVTPVLASAPCSALVASVHDQTVDVQGFVSEKYGLARLKESLGRVAGVRATNFGVQQVSDDKCDLLTMLAPYWTANRQAGRPASVHTRSSQTRLTEGDPLIVELMTPAFDSYVNIDYFMLDGSVVHLLPNGRSRDNQAPPSYSATIGAMGEWVVGKPFGAEMIVLTVAPAPLFDAPRPDSEAKPEYLRAVDKRLKALAARYGRERVLVDIFQITTQPKK